jgi:hypothetical protein
MKRMFCRQSQQAIHTQAENIFEPRAYQLIFGLNAQLKFGASVYRLRDAMAVKSNRALAERADELRTRMKTH